MHPPVRGRIFLITGIMASGKSTIAQAVAERTPRSVHLRGDLFRRMIVNGQEPVTPDNWPAAEQQLHLRQQLAASVATTYANNGYTVVYQDVILGADLPRVVDMIQRPELDIHVVVLAPDPGIVAVRDQQREKTGYGDWTPAELDHTLRTETPRIGFWLDTTELSISTSVDTILSNLEQSRIQNR